MPYKQYLIDQVNNKNICPNEKEAHIKTIKGLSESDLSYILYDTTELKGIYKEYPVDIGTFIHDPFFMGNVYGDSIYPVWEELLHDIYPAPLITRYDEVILSSATRCHGKGTKILMYDGSIKNVEDIKVGDQVMGDDSTSRNVLSLARGREMMYKVIPNKGGDPFTCNESHILSLRCTSDKERSQKYTKGNILNITIKEYLKQNKIFKHMYKLYKVPVEFKEQSLGIDPYIYGLWLGDGSTNKPCLTTVDKEIADTWCNYGKDILGLDIRIEHNKNTSCKTYFYTTINEYNKGKKVVNKDTGEVFSSIGEASRKYNTSSSNIRCSCTGKNGRKTSKGFRWGFLEEETEKIKIKRKNIFLSFIKNSVNNDGHKKIRKEFLHNSKENRLKLLAGIVDSDGYVLKNKACLSISTKIKTLSEDYAFLARSLGFRTTIKERTKFVKSIGKNYTHYEVNISGKINEIPTILMRKRSQPSKERVNFLNTGFNIEPVGVDDYYGFKLDGNNLYLLGDFTVTHNCGKSVVGSISAKYEMYKLMCMKDPAAYFLGISSAKLVIGLLSYSEDQVKKGLASYIMKGLELSPFFIDNRTGDLALSNLIKGGMHVTSNIVISGGSDSSRITGGNLYTSLLDEANLPPKNIPESELVERRMELYRDMLDRKAGTLAKAPVMSGITWMMSSPMEDHDVISERIYEVQSEGIRRVKIIDNLARWEAQQLKVSTYFEYFLGSDTKEPRVLDEQHDFDSINVERNSNEYKKLKEEEKIISVPDIPEYRTLAKTKPVRFIRNVCGRRTSADLTFFPSVSVFEKVFKKEQDIFSKDILTIDFDIHNENKNLFEPYLLNKNYFKNPHKRNCNRYIHIDIAWMTDLLGLASVYSDMLTFISEEGNKIRRRFFYVDFCLGIQSSAGKTVDILNVLKFVYNLKKLGYPLKKVTTDSQQGVLARQIISKKAVETDYLSLDISKEPYENLKNIMMEGLLEGYKNPPLIKDLKNLRDFGKKICKPKGRGYSDDMSNALAGAVHSCLMDEHGFKAPSDVIEDLLQINHVAPDKVVQIVNQQDIKEFNEQVYDAYTDPFYDILNNSILNGKGKLGHGL